MARHGGDYGPTSIHLRNAFVRNGASYAVDGDGGMRVRVQEKGVRGGG